MYIYIPVYVYVCTVLLGIVMDQVEYNGKAKYKTKIILKYIAI